MGEKDLISYLIYDEAYCISQCSNGFGPDYLAVVEMCKILVPKAPIILSAIATQDAISDIKQKNRLQYLNIIQGSFNRPNLSYEVEEKQKDTEKNIIQVISSTESALIYCSTKRE